MRLRSLLFVPGDRPDRFAKAAASGADALILDLEDAVAPAAKATARTAVAACLDDHWSGPPRFVRLNPLGSDELERDLTALARRRPDGLVLPKAEGVPSITALDALLEAHDLARLPLLPIATETPTAIFALCSYAAAADRLAGLTWGAEDLSAAVGATSAREADGRYTPPYELARSLCLFAAHAAGAAAIDTVYPDLRDEAGLIAYAARAARDGFTGMLALHPSQVAAINAAFTPDASTIARAQAIVDAFAAAPHAGALAVDGRMVDAPHLTQARAILQRVHG